MVTEWERLREHLGYLLEELGVPLRVEVFWDRLWAYLVRLAERAAELHLTACRTLEERLETQVLESLVLAHLLPPGGYAVADLGSGGGVPGLILKIARPELEVVLYEAHPPRVAFLQGLIAELGLSGVRAERRFLGREGWPETRFPVVVSRGYGSAEKFAAQAARLLSPPGLAFYLWRNEVEPRGEPERYLRLLQEVSLALPRERGERRLLIFAG